MIRLLYSILSFVSGFVLIDNYDYSPRKTISFCNNVNPLLREKTIKAVNYLNEYDIVSISLYDDENIFQNQMDSINSICDYKGYNGYFGYTSYYNDNKETDVSISNILFSTPNTLFNTVLHEIVHTLGLNHTDKQGMMNYKLRLNNDGYVIDDDRELWLGRDDIKGLRFIRQSSCSSIN